MKKKYSKLFSTDSLKVSDDGKKALIKLANGDMRKVLNVLQSTWMAYKDVTEETVYLCVGHPTTSDIKSIINWLMSVESFEECYDSKFDINMEIFVGFSFDTIDYIIFICFPCVQKFKT